MSKISDLLAANKTDTVKGNSKSSVPVQDADPFYDAVYNAYIISKDAETAYESLKSQLLDRTDAMYAESAKNGSFSKSFNLPGVQTPGVQISYKDQFSAIPVESTQSLKDAMGAQFNQFFEEKRELQLADTSDDGIDAIIQALGEEKFLKLFNIKVTISAKKDMDRRQFALGDNVRNVLKQYKPNVKISK